MPISQIVDGKVLDWHFKQLKLFEDSTGPYSFCIGDTPLGQVFKMGKHEWTAISNKPHPFNGVDGFGTRYAAAKYILKLHGYRV